MNSVRPSPVGGSAPATPGLRLADGGCHGALEPATTIASARIENRLNGSPHDQVMRARHLNISHAAKAPIIADAAVVGRLTSPNSARSIFLTLRRCPVQAIQHGRHPSGVGLFGAQHLSLRL